MPMQYVYMTIAIQYVYMTIAIQYVYMTIEKMIIYMYTYCIGTFAILLKQRWQRYMKACF